MGNQKQLLTAKKRLQIQESKYLGGDIEHTHLVKGLDYALLEKKRAEIREEEKKKGIEKGMIKGGEIVKMMKWIETIELIEMIEMIVTIGDMIKGIDTIGIEKIGIEE